VSASATPERAHAHRRGAAQLLGLEAMKWPGLRRRASIGIVAGIAAFAATAVLSLMRNAGAGSAPLPLAALSTVGTLHPIGNVGPLGPEDVPIPNADALPPPRPLAIPLLAHAEIQLDVGRPLIAPENITFPPRL